MKKVTFSIDGQQVSFRDETACGAVQQFFENQSFDCLRMMAMTEGTKKDREKLGKLDELIEAVEDETLTFEELNAFDIRFSFLRFRAVVEDAD